MSLDNGGVVYLEGAQVDTGNTNRSTNAINGIPKFFLEAKKDQKGNYRNVEYVQIIIPGDNKTSPVKKVTDSLRDKYRPWYEIFRKGLKESDMGVPLEMWPVVTPAQIHELKAANIFTVEQLRDLSDSNLHSVPFGRTLKNKARLWLETKEKTDAVEKHAAENKALQDSMRQMQEQIEALTAQLSNDKQDEQKKPARRFSSSKEDS